MKILLLRNAWSNITQVRIADIHLKSSSIEVKTIRKCSSSWCSHLFLKYYKNKPWITRAMNYLLCSQNDNDNLSSCFWINKNQNHPEETISHKKKKVIWTFNTTKLIRFSPDFISISISPYINLHQIHKINQPSNKHQITIYDEKKIQQIRCVALHLIQWYNIIWP